MSTIFPDEKDHAFHLARRHPSRECPECQRTPRWPIKKVGFCWYQNDEWHFAGWEFDTSEPNTLPWLKSELFDFARTQAEIMRLPELEERSA